MENSTIKAKYLNWNNNNDNEIEKYHDNITNYVKDYNYGDLIAFSSYRDTGTYIVGKDGNLIGNPDYTDSGYLTIPYEITQYLDDALNKYEMYLENQRFRHQQKKEYKY